MNLAISGVRCNASQGVRSLAARSFARRNSTGRSLADTSRTVTGKACPPQPMNGRHYLMQKNFPRHCCRQVHDQPSGSSSSNTFRERLGELRRNGTPEIAFGSIILALAGIDYFLQVRYDEQRDDAYRQLEREVRRDEVTTRKEDRRMINEGVAAKSKFKCTIRNVPQNFDGHKCLKNVKVGDVVDVIEEGVGPGGQYNLCTIDRGAAKTVGKDSQEGEQRVSIGWFPCSCLQKIK
mmetsp:Transcript_31519/g.66291  ORF Transcript_31519/g.66291 Transcript_31519/m.66291 type:complete len:236 (+) Transcript_31519:102-809(+)